ncbi:AB hydrolase-1 domain-containing protein [Fusarium keratoplasticum]|uniref:AB hydrolase-1 domain-containing protein n=1 Tax=Fusarium keratoplasticum TaxID=1328300 RepID=A0ACC0QJK5_9HYPO|nr:AB hydrolase-1 domain-containing protein [Fusarium keratoplasticum]KAI8654491.1 AB hydrolase-1 domain-containing protein [Fusarium keratoplasticum]
MASVFNIAQHVIEASHIREYARATSHSQDEKLHLHVKQYIPKDNLVPRKGDVTIIGAHANGFPKATPPQQCLSRCRPHSLTLQSQELYEPLWEDLYHDAKSRNLRIRSIYIADAAWQGQSGVLNHDALGNDRKSASWLDHARDILHIINTLRPPPPLVGIGHSFGASILANVALIHPRLMTSLVLLDPVISRFTSTPSSAGPAAASLNRRDVWPSREEAAKSFGQSPFYRTWDPRVLQRWIEHGLRNMSGTNAVTLTTTKHQEVFTYVRPSWDAYDAEGREVIRPDLAIDLDPSLNENWPTYPVYRPEGPRTLASLPALRPSVLYLFGGRSEISSVELREEKLALTGTGVGGSGGVKAGRVSSVVSEESGHLVPLEAPGLCARVAAEWMASELTRWLAEEREYEAWARRPAAEKTTMSDQLRHHVSQMRIPTQWQHNNSKI